MFFFVQKIYVLFQIIVHLVGVVLVASVGMVSELVPNTICFHSGVRSQHRIIAALGKVLVVVVVIPGGLVSTRAIGLVVYDLKVFCASRSFVWMRHSEYKS
jgi:hypothetical protein